jgi:hypothetical protein
LKDPIPIEENGSIAFAGVISYLATTEVRSDSSSREPVGLTGNVEYRDMPGKRYRGITAALIHPSDGPPRLFPEGPLPRFGKPFTGNHSHGILTSIRAIQLFLLFTVGRDRQRAQ